jgi:hypothetical protein
MTRRASPIAAAAICRAEPHLGGAVPLGTANMGARAMTLDVVVIQPVIALIAGILILLMPRLLNYIVAIYLIVIGLAGIWPRLVH